MSERWTREQLAAVNSRGRNLLVAAAASPPANTPGMLVSKVLGFISMVPRLDKAKPGMSVILTLWPMAAITVSASKVEKASGIGSGLHLPDASGSPKHIC